MSEALLTTGFLCLCPLSFVCGEQLELLSLPLSVSLPPNPLSYLMLYYAIILMSFICVLVIVVHCFCCFCLFMQLLSMPLHNYSVYMLSPSLTHMCTHTHTLDGLIVAIGNSASGEQCSPLKCKVITSSSPSASPYTPPPPPPSSQAQEGETLDTK